MKAIKKFSILSLLIILLMSTCIGCKVKKEDVVGTWQASGTYNGNYFVHILVLSEDNTYIKSTSKNYASPKLETGGYVIGDNVISCYLPEYIINHGMSTPYTYKNGKLECGVWIYTKTS